MQKSARVAIIDDERSIRRALMHLFRFAQYEAEAFSSASEFLESYGEGRRPDCIVLDLKMPGMSGVELIRHLVTIGNPPPIIVVTANGEEELADECMRLGTMRYLQKPVDCESLVESVRDAIG